MSGVETLTIAAGEADVRLDRWFKKRFPGLSHGRLEKLLRTGQIRVDGRRAKAGQRLAAGNRVRVPPLPEDAASAARKRDRPQPSDADLALAESWVIYRDDHVLAINKPAGIAVQGGSGITRHVDALLDGLKFDALERPRLVHRLDKDTSGLMVAAKNDAAHAALSAQFAGRQVKRAYTAVAWGVPSPRAGAIEGNIGRSPANRKKMAVVQRGGKPARTRYRVLRALGPDAAPLASVLECRLETGRTHQIRVHLAAKGHPLVGDRLYGRARGARWGRLDPGARRRIEAFGRQALDAHLLGFSHPRTDEILEFKKSLTADIVGLIEVLNAVEGT